ncbi:hypothetical protein PBT90_11120 [Algoriphagus halophytocola]|uniref:hypothetical protein n=1 Tax=Algoriphagus halophytocola TaxID=2991499 RepID=UPI0022DD3577|nr:hypothetical protein [Algoriphagus sp. TR-M9]WBL41307.1 hypothetical protein PBT90_11120 [Algoriphagus sp. TR-M9]
MKKSHWLAIKYFVYQLKFTLDKKKPILPALKYFFYYIRVNTNSPVSSFEKGLPWISYGSLKFLEKRINKEMKVFEYGSGGSTIYFSRKVKQVISIEHNQEWYSSLKIKLKELGINNVKLDLISPEKINSLASKAIKSQSSPIWENYDFTKYVNSINSYENSYFDLIVIDGRVRIECLKNSLNKLKSGGYLLFDNSERERYQNELGKLKTWVSYKNYGPVVQEYSFSETTIFRKR